MDSLSKFGNGFQTKAISALLQDSKFMDQMQDLVNPKLFESESHAWIVDRIMWYFGEYRKLPTLEVFKQEVDKIKGNDELKSAVIDSLKEVYRNISAEDLDYVKDEYLEFCKNISIKTAILKSVDRLEVGDYPGIKTLMDKAYQAGEARDYGHDWIVDVEKRLIEDARTTIPTGWAVIDDVLDGGLGGGELGIIMAPASAGKSWGLAHIGKCSILAGRKVLHYSLELNERYLGNRYDTLMTGIEPKQLRHHIDRVKEIVESVPGELKIKFYPARLASSMTLMAHTKRLLAIGFKPDIILVDYADLMIPSGKSNNSYEDLGIVYEELRSMAGELNIPIWSASQVQRAGLNDDVIGADRIAESFRKVMTADFIISLSRKTSDKLANTGRGHIVKNRFGPDSGTFLGEIDFLRGKFDFYNADSIEGRRIMQLMGESESEVKNLLLEKMREFKSERNVDLG